MEMTIDNCISKLTEILKETTEDENSVCYVTDADKPTLKMSIETIRKYQKITEIVEHYRVNVRDKVTNENMEKILEVVEDEKVD